MFSLDAWGILFYTFVMVLTVFGNALVISVIFSSNHSLSSVDIQLVFLAVIDLLMALVAGPIQLLSQTYRGNWPFPTEIECILSHYIPKVISTAHILVLQYIAIER